MMFFCMLEFNILDNVGGGFGGSGVECGGRLFCWGFFVCVFGFVMLMFLMGFMLLFCNVNVFIVKCNVKILLWVCVFVFFL